jgi:crossover junction endodeoxyribonuclease RuvC
LSRTLPAPVRILGLDPGLRRMGWGVVEANGARLTWVAHGVCTPSDAMPFSERLLTLFNAVEAIIYTHIPHEAAIEETFMANNAGSALKLGHARAAAMLAPARAGLVVAEYSAKEVK